MGKIKYRQAVLEFIAKTPVVTLASLKKMAGERYVHLLVHTLIKKRELYRLARGCYSRREDPTLTVFCFQPAYLGLQNALSIHNLWEQETNAIILTTKTVREGRRTVCGNDALL